MTNLNVLFNDEADVAVNEFKRKDFQEAFNAITQIRQKLFNEEPFFEIAHKMMELGILPRTNGTLPATYCDISYIYSQLSKAEVRLTQVKAYICEEKRMSEMSDMERVCGDLSIDSLLFGYKKLYFKTYLLKFGIILFNK